MSLEQVSECLWCAYGNNRESEYQTPIFLKIFFISSNKY